MTRFADMSRVAARAWLAAFSMLLLCGIFTSLTTPRWSVGMQGTDDLSFYRNVAAKVHEGRDYYQALDEEFGEGARTTSVFNWRQPTLAILIGNSPNLDVWFWAFMLAAIASVICTVQILVIQAPGFLMQVLATILLMGGSFSWSIYEHDTYLATEPWCEVLLLLSLCAYARGWRLTGMLLAVAGLCLRELMLPYFLTVVVIAIWKRRKMETAIGVISLLIYAYLMHCHAQAVAQHHSSAGVSVSDWLRAPNLHFILVCLRMNIFLRPLPPLFAAIYLPVALLGLIGWRDETGLRVTLAAAVYVLVYSVVWAGDYWGYILTPLLLLGALRSPASFQDLWMCQCRRRRQGEAF